MVTPAAGAGPDGRRRPGQAKSGQPEQSRSQSIDRSIAAPACLASSKNRIRVQQKFGAACRATVVASAGRAMLARMDRSRFRGAMDIAPAVRGRPSRLTLYVAFFLQADAPPCWRRRAGRDCRPAILVRPAQAADATFIFQPGHQTRGPVRRAAVHIRARRTRGSRRRIRAARVENI